MSRLGPWKMSLWEKTQALMDERLDWKHYILDFWVVTLAISSQP